MIKSFFTIVSFCIALVACAQQPDLDANAFQQKIAEKGIQLLDVRTIGEYNSGYIKNALQADWNNQAQFNDRTQYLDKTKPVYVYCASGGRSGAAVAALRAKGFNAINLAGGMTAWKRAGKPVEGLSTEGKISTADYTALTKQSDIVLIDFGAQWCPPCKKMEPTIAALKAKKIATVNYVDGGVNTDLMPVANVEAFPTFILYKKGKEVWRKQGIVSLEEFEKVIKGNK